MHENHSRHTVGCTRGACIGRHHQHNQECTVRCHFKSQTYRQEYWALHNYPHHATTAAPVLHTYLHTYIQTLPYSRPLLDSPDSTSHVTKICMWSNTQSRSAMHEQITLTYQIIVNTYACDITISHWWPDLHTTARTVQCSVSQQPLCHCSLLTHILALASCDTGNALLIPNPSTNANTNQYTAGRQK